MAHDDSTRPLTGAQPTCPVLVPAPAPTNACEPCHENAPASGGSSYCRAMPLRGRTPHAPGTRVGARHAPTLRLRRASPCLRRPSNMQPRPATPARRRRRRPAGRPRSASSSATPSPPSCDARAQPTTALVPMPLRPVALACSILHDHLRLIAPRLAEALVGVADVQLLHDTLRRVLEGEFGTE